MTELSGQSPLIDEHVFLIGRPPLAEYLGFLTNQTVGGDKADVRSLAEEWRSANDHIHELEKREAGYADSPQIAPLADRLASLVGEVLKDPIFQRSFTIVPATVGIVELDRLVVFQKLINLNYIRQIQQQLGSTPSDEAVFKVCLPFDHPRPAVEGGRIANNAYMFISPSTDLRFLEPTLLRLDQIIDYSPQGPVAGVIALVIGFGSNFLNAIYVENRLILNNGSHRAFALRQMGVTHVPCVVQHVSRREELAVIAAGDVAQNADPYLKAVRPPLLKDYFDSRLRKEVNVARRLRQVKIAFGVEQIDIPDTRQ